MAALATLEISNRVAQLKLNRPEVYNSINRPMALQLLELLKRCESDEGVRVVVLLGEGKAFCAGQDLQEAIDPDGPDIETIVREHYNALILGLRRLEKPVIAGLNGVAAGAGANLALACDIVVASESASLVQAFSKIGLIPDSAGTFILPRIVGLHRASALCMTGDKVTAKEAMQMGLVYQVFPDDEFHHRLLAFATQIAEMPTRALVLTKQLLNSSYNNTLEQQLELELLYQKQAANTDDFKEGIQAFLEKRKPVFKGR